MDVAEARVAALRREARARGAGGGAEEEGRRRPRSPEEQVGRQVVRARAPEQNSFKAGHLSLAFVIDMHVARYVVKAAFHTQPLLATSPIYYRPQCVGRAFAARRPQCGRLCTDLKL